MKLIQAIILSLFLYFNIFPQTDTVKVFEFIPSGLHMLPLKTNNQEARFGLQYYLKGSDLKLDIGNSIDLVKYNFDNGQKVLTFGIEFMAYAFSTNYEQKRLQIDAVDGLFGGNAVFSMSLNTTSKFYTRFRIIHNSAHLVDGHYNTDKKIWVDGREPIPYTRDFGELILMHEIHTEYMLRYYGGVSYSTLIRPLDQKKYNACTGFELAFPNLLGKLFDKDENIFCAYQLSFVGIPNYIGNNNLMAGIKFGKWNGKGLLLYAAYYSGNNVFSEYFRDRIRKFGIGFSIDFQ